jgi:hypothetical protein
MLHSISAAQKLSPAQGACFQHIHRNMCGVTLAIEQNPADHVNDRIARVGGTQAWRNGPPR